MNTRVEYGCTCVNLTGIYAEEAELTDEGVGSDLERESCKRLVVRSGSFFLSVCFGVSTLDSGDVGRSGHVVDNGVEHHLNALVAVRRTAGYGNHSVIDGSLTDHLLDLVNGDLLALEVFLHELLVKLRNGLDELLMVFLGDSLHVIQTGDELLILGRSGGVFISRISAGRQRKRSRSR